MHLKTNILVSLTVLAAVSYGADKQKKAPEPSALDKYLQEALKQTVAPVQPSAGSIWSPASRLTDVAADVRAVQVDDLVTILVNEQASAVATGATQTSRATAAQSQVTALGGKKSPNGAAANLLN